jgi:hypothetical protein
VLVLTIDEVVSDAARDQRADAAIDLAGAEQRGNAARHARSLARLGTVFARDLEQCENRRRARSELDDLHSIQGSGQRQQTLALREPANQNQPPAVAASAATRIGYRADARDVDTRQSAQIDYNEPRTTRGLT